MSCSTFPHLLAPDLLPLHSFPQFSFIESSFHKPSFHLASASLLCHTQSPPMWSWAGKSIIELLIIVLGGSSSSQAQCLTQQIPTPQNKLRIREEWLARNNHRPGLGLGWGLAPMLTPRNDFSTLLCLVPRHPRINPSLPTQLEKQKSLFHCSKQSKY